MASTADYTTNPQREVETEDPFASQREPGNNPFAQHSDEPRRASDSSVEDGTDPLPLHKRDRRMSKEWDAAKTPPSRFQKVEGSVFATPASRDGHVARNKIHGFKEKVKELGKRKGSI